jgi:chloride channel protein, CIC family
MEFSFFPWRAPRDEDGPGKKPATDDDTTYLGTDVRAAASAERTLGDFTTTWDTVRLVPLALVVGVVGAGVSLGLLDLIGLFTNLFYYGRWSAHLVSPSANSLGPLALVIPVAGGVVVGLMARFGSEQIRGHGIPEAMENVLINGSRVQPRLAILKPLSSAISIGTGGPFGAEGPIILTGGALGSIAGQLFRLTAIQRRTLLVAGAAAGMSAVFGTPVAATLFGVELLAFEWRPRSMVPIALAAAVADGLRLEMASAHLVRPQPLFPVAAHGALGPAVLAGAALVGVGSGLAAWVFTQAVYRAEDLFLRLRRHLHWMWWPAIGGLLIGLGGLVDARALGVGYDTIGAELLGQIGLGALALLLVTKLVIWAGALGSGTSGGILAPILMMGAALGAIVGHLLPGGSPAVWSLIGMGGALGGVTRSPFTAIVFSFELTHDQNSLLALLVAATLAHLVSVLVLKRSVLTEKVARRGFHVMREYAVDPLEAVFVREVMDAEVYSVEPGQRLRHLAPALAEGSALRRQRLLPVVEGGALVGVLPLSRILEHRGSPDLRAGDVMVTNYLVAHPDETLRQVAERMALSGVGVMPVVPRHDGRTMHGLMTQFDLLAARQRLLQEERSAERILRLRRLGSARAGGAIRPRPPVDEPPLDGDEDLGLEAEAE